MKALEKIYWIVTILCLVAVAGVFVWDMTKKKPVDEGATELARTNDLLEALLEKTDKEAEEIVKEVVKESAFKVNRQVPLPPKSATTKKKAAPPKQAAPVMAEPQA